MKARRLERGPGRLTHLDARGQVRMVDVGAKRPTRREAVAAGRIAMGAAAFAALRAGSLAKGDAGAVARLAGIAAAKRTAEIIPLCHVVPLDHVSVGIRFLEGERAVEAEAKVRTRWSTGVEMEALVAVAAALLAIYDMAKALDRGMTLGPIRLLRKSGGRSGTFVRAIGSRARTGARGLSRRGRPSRRSRRRA
jgi:cyclic pyranopterin phosphate synthase